MRALIYIPVLNGRVVVVVKGISDEISCIVSAKEVSNSKIHCYYICLEERLFSFRNYFNTLNKIS